MINMIVRVAVCVKITVGKLFKKKKNANNSSLYWMSITGQKSYSQWEKGPLFEYRWNRMDRNRLD